MGLLIQIRFIRSASLIFWLRGTFLLLIAIARLVVLSNWECTKLYSFFKAIAFSALLCLFSMDSAESFPPMDFDEVAPSNNFQGVTNIEQTARQISVRIFPAGESGSGVIVARRGSVYTVITNAHVVGSDDQYKVMTSDGITHSARRLPSNSFNGLDLALVTFESPNNYQVAELNLNPVAQGARLYSAGFPSYHYPNDREIQSTENWGIGAFALTAGQAGIYSDKPLLQGYQLGYTNEVREGMSGGAVIDEQGKLVGINGRLSNPVQGRSVFIYTDGTQVSPQLFQQIESLSWAIPVTTFQFAINN